MATHEMTLKGARLSYFYALGEGKVNDEGKRSWSTTAIIPKNHPQIDEIKACIAHAKVKDAVKLGGTTGIKNPLLDGDAKDDDGNFKYKDEELRGCYFLRCANYNRRPAVVDQNVQPILDPDLIYSGCYANVRISFYGYKNSTGRGISPGLDAIQKTKDGERLSAGGVNPNDVFSAVEEDFLA